MVIEASVATCGMDCGVVCRASVLMQRMLALRPGCTGQWQTAGRNRTTFEARAEYDTTYEAELSLWSDIMILFRTVGVMLKGTGY